MQPDRSEVPVSRDDSRAWFAISVEETYEALDSDPGGLAGVEAARRLDEYGPNELRVEQRESLLAVFARQFTSFLILLLIGAGILSLILGETLDAIVILAIVLLSGLLGFIQEYRASRAIEALQRLAAPVATAVRDGVEVRVPARDLVPGDVVLLAAGDRVAADLRAVEAHNLKTAEASLTGESEPVTKTTAPVEPDAALGDRVSMLYAGTTVVYGRGAGVVVATGMRSEFGKIAHLVQTPKAERTPLEEEMDEIGRKLGVAGLVIVVLVVGLELWQGGGWLLALLAGISLAVAAVPEALPAVVTGALTVGVQRMARRHAIVRHLPAVETLGSTTVICTDKTGTLTAGEMTVRRVVLGDRTLTVTGAGYGRAGQLLDTDGRDVDPAALDLRLLAHVGVLCNDAHVRYDETGGATEVTGDPTEAALVVLAEKVGVGPEPVRLDHRRLGEVPFTSERKRMTTVHDLLAVPKRRPPGASEQSAAVVCTKGAPEVVLDLCSTELVGGELRPLDTTARRRWLDAGRSLADDALRVLGFAYRALDATPTTTLDERWESDLIFVGLVGMADPPRPEVAAALRETKSAHVRTIMITGDHLATARAVGRELGIVRAGDRAIEGRALDGLSDAELDETVPAVAVYARVSPEHKLRIVDSLKRRGEVVAMTGDGLNDAPALHRADIGVAMGITGTEVTREAADLILTDDNYATIAAAMEEGRGIFDNVKKYLAFLLSSNVGELLIIFIAGLLFLPLPLLPVQILWANLVTDGLPAIALGIERPEPDVMRRAPRPRGQSVFTVWVLTLIGVVSILMTVAVLLIYYAELVGDGDLMHARTLAFTTIVMFEMFHAFNCRSEKYSIFKVGVTGNRWLILAVAISVLLHLAVLYVPALEGPFQVVPPTASDWLIILGAASTAIIGAEIAKLVLRRRLGVVD